MQKVALILQIMTLTALSAFSGALLFVALVLVKFWQSIEPQAYLAWMSEHFFRLPTVMVPLNMVSLLLAIAALAASWKTRPQSRIPLMLGLVSLIACTLTFPIYFAGANAELVASSVELGDVGSKIAIWSNWNWLRTGLAILSTIFVGLAALTSENSDVETVLSVIGQ